MGRSGPGVFQVKLVQEACWDQGELQDPLGSLVSEV